MSPIWLDLDEAMSETVTPGAAAGLLQGFLQDRRKSGRYPVLEKLQYRVVKHRSDKSAGTGWTSDMSSSGMLFTTEGAIPLGRTLEVSVCWPAQLDGSCPLKLVVVGEVVRSDASGVAVRIQRHEFRTRGNGPGRH